MKKLIFIFVCLIFGNLTSAQSNYDFSKLVGKYDGYLFDLEKGEPNKTVKVKIELLADYTISVKVNNNGIWVDYILNNLKSLNTKISEHNNLDLFFKVTDPNSKWTKAYFSIPQKSLNYKGIFLTFINKNNLSIAFEIVKQEGNRKTQVIRKPLPQVIKQKNIKIQRHLNKIQREINSFTQSNDFIIKTLSKVNQSTNRADWQNYLNDIIRKYAVLRIGTNTAIKEIVSAISEAKKSNCKKTQKSLGQVKEKLLLAKAEFLSAEASTRSVMLSSKKEEIMGHSEDANRHGNLAFESLTDVEKFLIVIDEFWPCYGASSENNNSLPKVKPPITRDPTGKSNLVGVGLAVGSNNKYKKGLHINNSVKGWAAYRAGMHEGMTLLEINDKEIGDAVAWARENLVGENGTKVKVKFINASGKEREYILYRGAGGKAVDLLSENKIQVSRSKISSSPPDNLPAFHGKYEGDNFFRLMGRQIDDPSIKNFIKDPSIQLKRSSCELDGDCWYKSDKGLNVKFNKGILTIITFKYYAERRFGQFEGKVPRGIPLGENTALMQAMSNGWEYEKTKNHHIWESRKYQIQVKVYALLSTEKINIVQLNGKNVDWNTYHQQFEDLN